MKPDTHLVDTVRGITTNPANYPTLKGSDREFLSRLCEVWDRTGKPTLTSRQRNIVGNIIDSLEIPAQGSGDTDGQKET